jgi:hypothetical protein
MYTSGVVPMGIAVFGRVMLLKPTVPLGPVIVKDTVVVVADWFVEIVTLDIWELVMFPLIARSNVEPLSIIAVRFVVDGVGAGEGVGVTDAGVDVVVEVGEGVGDVGVEVGANAKVAVIVPVPPIVAVEDAEFALLKVIDPVLDDQELKV